MLFGSSKAYISKKKINKAQSFINKAQNENSNQLSIVKEEAKDEPNYLCDMFDYANEAVNEDIDEAYNSGAESVLEEDLHNHSFTSNINQCADLLDLNEPQQKSVQRKKEQHLPHQKVFRQEVDTNVVVIPYSNLKEKSALATGDPVTCAECKAIFNVHSKIEVSEGQQVWNCEFCNHPNPVIIDEEEIPKEDAMNFILESAVQANEKHLGNSEEDISVVFCIDISGSMCVSKPIAGKVNIKGDHRKDMQELMKFSDGSEQYLDNEGKHLTYISRLQCVQAAIEQQIIEMEGSAPLRKVGIVTFSNEVHVLGDGTQQTKTIAGDKLKDYGFLLEDSLKTGETYLNKAVKDTKEILTKKVLALEEGGPTALGPALLTAVGMASKGKSGSKVVVCTDGLANVGLGLFDEGAVSEQSRKFYEDVGLFAKDNGVCVSLISIIGEECQIGTLSTLCELTGGDIQRVDPEHLTQNFANILTNEIIATHVVTKVKLHKGLEFRNEDPALLSEDKSLLVRELGNVTADTEITFEYTLKRPEELMKIKNFDITKLTELPFQTQTTYRTLDGMKCVRVITQIKQVTNEKEEVEKAANVQLLHINAAQKAATHARRGSFSKAQANMVQWGRQIQRTTANNSNQIDASNDMNVYNNGVVGMYNMIQESVKPKAQMMPAPMANPMGYGGMNAQVSYNSGSPRRMEAEKSSPKKGGFFSNLFGGFGKKNEEAKAQPRRLSLSKQKFSEDMPKAQAVSNDMMSAEFYGQSKVNSKMIRKPNN